jgi:hypothetical protein
LGEDVRRPHDFGGLEAASAARAVATTVAIVVIAAVVVLVDLRADDATGRRAYSRTGSGIASQSTDTGAECATGERTFAAIVRSATAERERAGCQCRQDQGTHDKSPFANRYAGQTADLPSSSVATFA